MNYVINYANIDALCEKHDLNKSNIVVYGHENCINYYGRYIGYLGVKFDLIKTKKTFDYQLALPYEHQLTYPFLKNKFTKINLNDYKDKELCKAGIVDVVLQNYIRVSKGKKIIPLIFFIGSNKSYYQISSSSVCQSSRMTDSELRRCYKLMHLKENITLNTSIDLDIKISKFEEIAEKTFHAMSIDFTSTSSLEVNESSLPWKNNDWKSSWEQRKNHLETSKSSAKEFPWKEEIIRLLVEQKH